MNILELISEECPTPRVVKGIIEALSADKVLPAVKTGAIVAIKPVMDDKGRFSYLYQVEGISIEGISEVFVTIGRGQGSFVDYIATLRNDRSEVGASLDVKPLALIEVTKTVDGESRNTASFQRLTKFVTTKMFYSDVPIYMYYDVRVQEKKKRSASALFADRCTASMGIRIIRDGHIAGTVFGSLEEFIATRSAIKAPASGQPIKCHIKDGVFYISILLSKKVSGSQVRSGKFNHDPNIGAATAFSYLARKVFGWTGRIVITDHGVVVTSPINNKGSRILHDLNVELDGQVLSVPPMQTGGYYTYDRKTEKVASIFLATLVRNNPDFEVLYENHGGSERGYFMVGNVAHVVPKKHGQALIGLPDLIFSDKKTKKIYVTEGEMGAKANIRNGLLQMDNFNTFIEFVIKKHYSDYSVTSELVTNGESVENVEKWSDGNWFFHLDSEGKPAFGPSFPKELAL